MRNIKAAHLGGYVDDATIAKLGQGGFGAVLAFDFQPVDDYLRLMAAIPGLRFGIRSYFPQGPLPAVADYAPQLANYLCQLTRAGVPIDFVAPGNEPNLEQGSDAASMRTFCEWWSAVYHYLKSRFEIHQIPVAFPALCPSLNMWEDFQICQPSMAQGDVLNVHVYVQDAEHLDNDYEGGAAHWYALMFPGKPLYITEWGLTADCDHGERVGLFPEMLKRFAQIPELRWASVFILEHTDPQWAPYCLDEELLDVFAHC